MYLIQEIARHLHNNGIGSLGTTLMVGQLPDVDADLSVAVLDTGGMPPDHDIVDIKHPTFQVFIRSKKYSTGKDALDSVRDLLHKTIGRRLLSASSIYFRSIFALAEGGHLGKNDAGYHEFSINFEAQIIE